MPMQETQERRCRRRGFNPWDRKIPQSRKWQPAPVFLPGKFHGQRSLTGCSPGGCKELDATEQQHHTLLLLLLFCRRGWILKHRHVNRFPQGHLTVWLQVFSPCATVLLLSATGHLPAYIFMMSNMAGKIVPGPRGGVS